jgi:hypothetical protein
VAGVTVDRDSLLLCPGEAEQPRIAPTFLQDRRGEVVLRFPKSVALHRLFVRVVRGTPESDAKIDFSEDGMLPSKRLLVAANDIPNVDNLRFWTVWRSEFYREMAGLQESWQRYETIRIHQKMLEARKSWCGSIFWRIRSCCR